MTTPDIQTAPKIAGLGSRKKALIEQAGHIARLTLERDELKAESECCLTR